MWALAHHLESVSFFFRFCLIFIICLIFFLRKQKSSVNRPPTPDVVEREPTFQELINIKVCFNRLIWAYLPTQVSYETQTRTLDIPTQMNTCWTSGTYSIRSVGAIEFVRLFGRTHENILCHAHELIPVYFYKFSKIAYGAYGNGLWLMLK